MLSSGRTGCSEGCTAVREQSLLSRSALKLHGSALDTGTAKLNLSSAGKASQGGPSLGHARDFKEITGSKQGNLGPGQQPCREAQGS